MARVLLLGSSEERTKALLIDWLRCHRHSVTVSLDKREWISRLKRDCNFDLLILFLAPGLFEDWKVLDHVRNVKGVGSITPRILCVSRSCLGPTIELEIERRGARLVHV